MSNPTTDGGTKCRAVKTSSLSNLTNIIKRSERAGGVKRDLFNGGVKVSVVRPLERGTDAASETDVNSDFFSLKQTCKYWGLNRK